MRIGAYQGAEFVTFRGRIVSKVNPTPPSQLVRAVPRGSQLLAAKLKGSKFKTKSDLDAFTECFDKGLKGNFSEDNNPQFVKFGSARDNDSRCDVKGGRLILQGWARYVHA